MQRLEVSGAVRLIYRSLGVKGLILLVSVIFMFLWRTYCLYVHIDFVYVPFVGRSLKV